MLRSPPAPTRRTSKYFYEEENGVSMETPPLLLMDEKTSQRTQLSFDFGARRECSRPATWLVPPAVFLGVRATALRGGQIKRHPSFEVLRRGGSGFSAQLIVQPMKIVGVMDAKSEAGISLRISPRCCPIWNISASIRREACFLFCNSARTGAQDAWAANIARINAAFRLDWPAESIASSPTTPRTDPLA